MATLYESFTTGYDTSSTLSTGDAAQTFTPSVSHTAYSVKLYLYRSSGTGLNIKVSIETVDGDGKPTGNILCSKTLDCSDLTTSGINLEWREFVFTTNPTLSAGIQYAIVAERVSGTMPGYWGRDTNTGSYADGKALYGMVGIYWTFYTGDYQDHLFEEYGNPILPGAPTNPSPEHEATGITLDESPLSWDASDPAADTYEIYFREQGEVWGNPIGVAQAEVEYILDFGYIDYEKTYEWKVDATNVAGTTPGTTWTFDSIVFDPPLPGAPGGGGGGGGGGGTGEENSPTGENNMVTLRRLVVAVENKIWYEDI